MYLLETHSDQNTSRNIQQTHWFGVCNQFNQYRIVSTTFIQRSARDYFF